MAIPGSHKTILTILANNLSDGEGSYLELPMFPPVRVETKARY